MQVDLKNAHAGMTLGADVVSAKGQLLLANGVQQVEVGGGKPADAVVNPDIAAVARELEERFRICDNQHPVIRELRRLCQQRLLGSPQKGEGDD